MHYTNAGRGHIQELSDMVKAIRFEEVKLGIQVVAIHLPGVLNVNPDTVSRYYTDAVFCNNHQLGRFGNVCSEQVRTNSVIYVGRHGRGWQT